MAMQPCRSGLTRGRHLLRSAPALRACYTTESSSSSSSLSTPPPSDSSHAAHPTPRWSQTPPAMKAPIQMDFSKNPKNKIWACNSDPHVLDDMYNRLLGPGGSRMLPEEVKWLAVTHKSFDQGRRGFNDRLALLGRSLLAMEASKHIVSKEPLKGSRISDDFSADRQPFEHAQLASVDNLVVEGPKDVAGKEKLYNLAQRVGMINVLRWKPRLPEALESSGVEVVMNGAILAIIGAINLQHGSVVASKIVRERILARVASV